MNVNLSGLSDLDPANRSDFCQPTTYCAWNTETKACGCAPGSACAAEKNDAVCAAGVKDLDCPVKGCYGFSITMPGSFTTFMTPKPPPPTQLYTATEPNYFVKDKVVFVDPGQAIAGSDCHYDPVPTQPAAKPPSRLPISLSPTVNLNGGGQ